MPHLICMSYERNADIRTGCPSGWVHIERSDERKKEGEYMYDESSCGPKGWLFTPMTCPPSLNRLNHLRCIQLVLSTSVLATNLRLVHTEKW
jgi:hypothetical protein